MSTNLTRRQFLGATTALGALAATPARAAEPSRPSARPSSDLIDANLSLGHWPFRRLPLDDTPLAAKLRRHGVTQAWTASFDALLHKDLAAANARLADECRRHGKHLLTPFGSVNPKQPDWEEDLRRCHEEHKMPGLRLHPNYHRYKLDDPLFARLLEQAGQRRMILQIALSMEDERVQHPLMPVPHVDASPLAALLKPSSPPVILLNWWRPLKAATLKKLAHTPGVFFDISTIELVGSIEVLLKDIPKERLVFGSLSPLFYFDSALLRLKESALPDETLQAIRAGNAQRLMEGRRFRA